MAAMDDEERAQIEILIHAKEDSAASLMTVDFISCPDTHTVSQALELIRKYADEVESIAYVYCTDEEMHLTGVISLRDLILASPGEVLANVMNKRLITLSLDDDWDAIATQFMKLRFRALPVVDSEGRMLGIVTFLHSFDELLPYYSRLAAA
jgi:magnesium transporter